MNQQNPSAPNNFNPSPTPPPFPQNNNEGDATGGVIPYKNPKALLAYYFGIFSGLPIIGIPFGIAAFVLGILGIPFGIAAFVLGILGLRDRSRNPAIKGSVHAGIGIGCGGLFTLLWGASIVMIIIGIVSGR